MQTEQPVSLAEAYEWMGHASQALTALLAAREATSPSDDDLTGGGRDAQGRPTSRAIIKRAIEVLTARIAVTALRAEGINPMTLAPLQDGPPFP